MKKTIKNKIKKLPLWSAVEAAKDEEQQESVGPG